MVFAVVVLNVITGFVQDYRANRAIDALMDMVADEMAVLRDGSWTSVPSGGVVPADARLLEVRGLQIDEAALTGESVPVSKHEDPVPEDAPVADRKSMVYSSTLVSYGTATGMETELGRISFRRRLCARAARVGAGSCRLVGGDGTLAQQIGVRAARGGGLPALAPP